MSAAEAMRVGWCPGALRPTMAGDGLLVRIKPRGGRIAVQACRTLAGLSGRLGNGVLAITGRANLQLRGVAEENLPELTAALAGLGLLDATPEGEAARNIVSAPLAGCDPMAILDIRPTVDALEQALANDSAFWRLPAKFAWTFDDGGALGLASVLADVSFAAVSCLGRPRFAIRLGGLRDAAAECGPDEVVAIAAALAAAFLELCARHGITPHRMEDLVRLCGGAAVFARAGLSSVPVAPAAVEPTPPRSIGLVRSGDMSRVGVAPPFGRLEAAWLDGFAALAERAGARHIRLTPWRTMLAADLSAEAAEALWAELAASGQDAAPLITDPADRRLAVVACVGAPACRRATVRVQEDAARLASCLPVRAGVLVHVSGCAKGCAHAQAAPVTLVGRDGEYDLVRDGKADGVPSLRGLWSAALAAALASWPDFDQIAASPVRPAAHREPVC